jgi:uncharacterized RDD family membrane protein YckC
MKCPKCEYLGFESSDRCRNCGYEFSLASQPLMASPDPLPPMRQPLDLDRIIGGPPQDLPLFPPEVGLGTPSMSIGDESGREGDSDDGKPLITAPLRPRAPLGVRRATPEVPRARMRTPRPSETLLFEGVTPVRAAEIHPATAPHDSSATAASRIMAALVDGAILFGLDAAVLYFTLRLCNLTASEMFELPVIPLLAFFLMLNGGYSVAFTAVGGQSIGKMALGIKVVGESDRPVPVGRAAFRTLAYFLSALPFGAGFLPGVMGVDRLALHDRLAHTRVVRPSSI